MTGVWQPYLLGFLCFFSFKFNLIQFLINFFPHTLEYQYTLMLLWIIYPCIKALLCWDSSGRLVGSPSWAVFFIGAVCCSGIVAFG